MHPNKYTARFIILTLLPITAHAYIDPGTGSVLIQGIIAAVAAVGVTLKLYWHRIAGFFRRKPSDLAVKAPPHDHTAPDDGGPGN